MNRIRYSESCYNIKIIEEKIDYDLERAYLILEISKKADATIEVPAIAYQERTVGELGATL